MTGGVDDLVADLAEAADAARPLRFVSGPWPACSYLTSRGWQCRPARNVVREIEVTMSDPLNRRRSMTPSL